MKKTRKAFTIVEVLVVIAIIVILGGLLVPAIQQARKAYLDRQNHVEVNYGQILYVTKGFYKGSSGRVLEERYALGYEYLIEINEKPVWIKESDLK